jgi:hypothetical protein
MAYGILASEVTGKNLQEAPPMPECHIGDARKYLLNLQTSSTTRLFGLNAEIVETTPKHCFL